MVNYANGKIYKITGGGLTYIGSTTQPLYKRYSGHKLCKTYFDKGDKSRSCSSSQILAFDDCCITLIEDFPCERKEQLLARERYYYDLMDCVNKCKPKATSEEIRLDHLNYSKLIYEKNKETISIQQKSYREKNKEKISAKNKEMNVCSCGIETPMNNKSRHDKSKKHLDRLASIGL